EAAGFPSGHRITLYARTVPDYQRKLAEVVSNQLERNLGWQVDVDYSPDIVRFMDKIADDADGLALFGWQADYPSGRAIMHPLLASDQVATPDNGLVNFSGWRNTQFDRYLDEASRQPNATSRAESLLQAERTALTDMAIIPMVHLATAALRSDRLTGLEMDHEGHPILATAAFR
ncbi:hypothetical protein ACFQ07_10530, partial [Actinomadura adrarensis]